MTLHLTSTPKRGPLSASEERILSLSAEVAVAKRQDRVEKVSGPSCVCTLCELVVTPEGTTVNCVCLQIRSLWTALEKFEAETSHQVGP